jgi:N-acetylglucosaminyldiphosphoundecaprenol N-acetyl-beta-D-mannosaminyltransferase
MNGRARARVLGCEIDRLDMEQTVALCERLIEQGSGAHHVSVNAAKLVAMHDDSRLAEIVGHAEIVNADGQSVVWASRLLRDPLPGRVAGIDLMERLLELAEQRGHRVYILGARDAVLERALAELRRRHPRLLITGARNGYFDDSESNEICAEIRAARPEVLFVAMSSPRKEYWLAEHGPSLDVPLVMGVGGSIDVVAGHVRRAPRWMQRAGLEWFFRFAQEPRRMGRRYVVTNTRFAAMLGAALVRRTVGRA